MFSSWQEGGEESFRPSEISAASDLKFQSLHKVALLRLARAVLSSLSPATVDKSQPRR